MMLFELISRGGIVMFILIAVSVYTFAVIFYKIFQFRKFRITDNAFIDKSLIFLQKGEKNQAINYLDNLVNPIGKVLVAAICIYEDKKMSSEEKSMLIETIGNKKLRVIESRLRSLEMIASISPLIGLLGTVIGMVKAFASIEEIGSKVDPSVLAGGIWEALLTTIAGLTVAIIAYAAHYFLDSQVERSRMELQNGVAHIFAGK